jgi:hypothetical protein
MRLDLLWGLFLGPSHFLKLHASNVALAQPCACPPKQSKLLMPLHLCSCAIILDLSTHPKLLLYTLTPISSVVYVGLFLGPLQLPKPHISPLAQPLHAHLNKRDLLKQKTACFSKKKTVHAFAPKLVLCNHTGTGLLSPLTHSSLCFTYNHTMFYWARHMFQQQNYRVTLTGLQV